MNTGPKGWAEEQRTCQLREVPEACLGQAFIIASGGFQESRFPDTGSLFMSRPGLLVGGAGSRAPQSPSTVPRTTGHAVETLLSRTDGSQTPPLFFK